MSNTFFNIFPNENFIDLCMYQFGYEQCDPGHSFGPATRNHYLFHYILSGTGTLMADNSKGETRIDKIFIWKNIKKCIAHKILLIYQNATSISIIA